MGWDFVTPLADVHLDDTVGVDRVSLVRVDGHAEETRISLQWRRNRQMMKGYAMTTQRPGQVSKDNSTRLKDGGDNSYMINSIVCFSSSGILRFQ